MQNNNNKKLVHKLVHSIQSFFQALKPSTHVSNFVQTRQAREKLRSQVKWLTFSIVGIIISAIPLYNAHLGDEHSRLQYHASQLFSKEQEQVAILEYKIHRLKNH